MSVSRPLRVMWLLNHTTLRQFEILQLNNLGIAQIYTPKIFPYDEANLSASVTFALDESLSLPASDIALLNAQDWYGEPAPAAWDIANAHFDLVFIGFFPRQILSACRHFKGAIVLRIFGLGGEETYSSLIRQLGGAILQHAIRKVSKRFWFGMGYDHLSDCEEASIKERATYMPVGLHAESISDQWQGEDKVILFVCPRIASSPYYHRIYKNFKQAFNGLAQRIGGAQPIGFNDPNILGFVSPKRYAELMQQCRVMFYHSQEPNHIHYHPFEAIHAGMPLVFMACGMLDRMGGSSLPGRCQTLAEARRKIAHILADDWDLIEQIRLSQTVLLDAMRAQHCGPAWHAGFARVVSGLQTWRSEQASRPQARRRKRVAVILPTGYRGGSLRGALALAKALHAGSRQWGEDADVVFAHLDDPATYPDEAFAVLPNTISRRPFHWKMLSAAEALRAMRYAGWQNWEPSADRYIAPDDGMQQMIDCDLWLIVSDRLSYPVLPVKPLVLMVYDYLQRYEDLLSHGADMPFLAAARSAEKVMVTTEFTYRDALQYAGIDPCKVSKMPMLAPEFPIQLNAFSKSQEQDSFFTWTTNAAPQKNHRNAAEALQIYYEELDGKWDCKVTGVNTKELLTIPTPHLQAMAEVFERSQQLRLRVKWMGELPNAQYRRHVSQARFLWHAGRIDNGTFSVIEAACLSVPSLSSDYPAMQEINAQFSLNLAWMNPDSPRDMAEQLKRMESDALARRNNLPGEALLRAQQSETLARLYWQEIRTCL